MASSILTDVDIQKFDSQKQPKTILSDADIQKFDIQRPVDQSINQPQTRFQLKKDQPYQNYSYGDALKDTGKTIINNFADVGDAARNIDKGIREHPVQAAKNVITGLFDTIRHPIDTLKSTAVDLKNKVINAPNKPIDAALTIAGTAMGAEGLTKGLIGVKNIIKPSSKVIEDKIFNDYNYITGTKIKNIREINTVKDKTLLGIKTMGENIPNSKFVNSQSGEFEVRAPQNRAEDLQLLLDSKKNVWGNVTKMSSGATDVNASIDYPSVVDKALEKTKKNLGRMALDVGEKGKTLSNVLDDLAAQQKSVGNVNPSEAQDYLRKLNADTKTLRNSANPIDNSSRDLYSNIIDELNTATDKSITDALGQGGYKAERAKYSALLSLEKQKIAAANRFIAQNSGKLGGVTHPISNLFSLENVIEGGLDIVTGNAQNSGGKFIRAGAIKTAQMIGDAFKNPDKRISNMYKLTGSLRGK